MPRSSADRAFGFQAKGLIRILTSADIDEVRKALGQLEIRVLPTGAGQAVKELIKAPFELLGGLLDFIFASVIPLNENLAELVRLLNEVIRLLEIEGHDIDTLHFQPIRDALAILRDMRSRLQREILLQSEFTSNAERVQNEAQDLEESTEVAINKVLPIEPVA